MSDEKNTPAGDAETVDPDELMKDVAGLSVVKTSLISVIFHVAVIGLTSIGFVMLCAEYDTWHPRAAMKEEARLKEEKQKQQDREMRETQRARDREKIKKQGKALKGAATRGQSPIEKAITETSTSRPTHSSMKLDDLD